MKLTFETWHLAIAIREGVKGRDKVHHCNHRLHEEYLKPFNLAPPGSSHQPVVPYEIHIVPIILSFASIQTGSDVDTGQPMPTSTQLPPFSFMRGPKILDDRKIKMDPLHITIFFIHRNIFFFKMGLILLKFWNLANLFSLSYYCWF